MKPCHHGVRLFLAKKGQLSLDVARLVALKPGALNGVALGGVKYRQLGADDPVTDLKSLLLLLLEQLGSCQAVVSAGSSSCRLLRLLLDLSGKKSSSFASV